MTRQEQNSPWFRYWQRKPHARVRLFCFPYAGGGASLFRTWSEHLSQEIEVCPIQLPGREERLLDRPFSTLSSLLEALAPLLQPYLDMPYALFGHSMGAMISFELARYFSRTHNLEPIHLFVSGHRAPQIPRQDPPTHNLPEPEFIDELHRLKGTPEKVLQSEELLRLLLPLLRADFALCETHSYTHQNPLKCPLSAFGGLQDTDVSRDYIAAWQKQTRGPFKMRFFRGNHFFLQKEQASLLHALTIDLFNNVGYEGP
jgi:medium-chain acyl-[acyl-carrier-protein] hydrolase